jgi:hypothetical protein
MEEPAEPDETSFSMTSEGTPENGPAVSETETSTEIDLDSETSNEYVSIEMAPQDEQVSVEDPVVEMLDPLDIAVEEADEVQVNESAEVPAGLSEEEDSAVNLKSIDAEEDIEPPVFGELEDGSETEEAAAQEELEKIEPNAEQSTLTTEKGTPGPIFEEEEQEDYFDLAAELEEGFLNVQSAVEEEKPSDGHLYSLEEILTDFKKGVEKQLGAEDYDTHYNLGIAFKEMGLIDEAIAEFQVASKDEKRFLECCSMLGLCFLEKGMPKLALKWYQRGLESPGHSEEEYFGLRYEIAQAYEAAGEDDHALESYLEVYGANAGYRNVAKKVKELRDKIQAK